MTYFFKKSYKNTRTKKSECPYGHSDFLMLAMTNFVSEELKRICEKMSRMYLMTVSFFLL